MRSTSAHCLRGSRHSAAPLALYPPHTTAVADTDPAFKDRARNFKENLYA